MGLPPGSTGLHWRRIERPCSGRVSTCARIGSSNTGTSGSRYGAGWNLGSRNGSSRPDPIQRQPVRPPRAVTLAAYLAIRPAERHSDRLSPEARATSATDNRRRQKTDQYFADRAGQARANRQGSLRQQPPRGTAGTAKVGQATVPGAGKRRHYGGQNRNGAQHRRETRRPSRCAGATPTTTPIPTWSCRAVRRRLKLQQQIGEDRPQETRPGCASPREDAVFSEGSCGSYVASAISSARPAHATPRPISSAVWSPKPDRPALRTAGVGRRDVAGWIWPFVMSPGAGVHGFSIVRVGADSQRRNRGLARRRAKCRHAAR